MEVNGGWVHDHRMNGVMGQWTVAVWLGVKRQACPWMSQTKGSPESEFSISETQPRGSTAGQHLRQLPALGTSTRAQALESDWPG